MQLQPFLTSYDPTDLPGGSVDPLGFDRGYTWLAEKILPGLTNAADQPRYLSALCAALILADGASSAATPRERERVRRGVVLRAERFWVLACVLASERTSHDHAGIRGIRYVRAAVERLTERGQRDTDANYRLLSRQATYGLLGIYGNVADNLHLVAGDGLALNADLGGRLGEAFLDETEAPPPLRRAVVEGGTVRLDALSAWGERAHVAAPTRAAERKALREALTANDARRRMVALLVAHPARAEETEIGRLQRISKELARTDRDPDLREALRAILAYERGFQETLLVFQRLLWGCQSAPFHVSLSALRADGSLAASRDRIARAGEDLDAALDAARSAAFLAQRERVADVRGFLRQAAHAQGLEELASVIVRRHVDVLRGRVSAGRSKMPWIELRDGRVVPTLAAAQRIERPPARAEDLPPHGYRTWAADRMLRAGGLS